jgi:hypothetical protein
MLKLWITILYIFIISSCGHDSSLDPGDNDFTYPIRLGNHWEYQRTFNSYSDSSFWQYDTVVTSTVEMKIISKEVFFDSVDVYLFQESLTETNRPTFESVTYYNNTENGLYFYAYRGPGYVIPKPIPTGKIVFKGIIFNSLQEITQTISLALNKRENLADSLYFETPPIQSLKYPIEVNSQWTYRYPRNPWHIEKKIISKEPINVPAGNFECYKIQWLYDMDHNGEWDEEIIFYDYLSSKGLIKRSISIFGINEVEPLQSIRAEDISVLTNINF